MMSELKVTIQQAVARLHFNASTQCENLIAPKHIFEGDSSCFCIVPTDPADRNKTAISYEAVKRRDSAKFKRDSDLFNELDFSRLPKLIGDENLASAIDDRISHYATLNMISRQPASNEPCWSLSFFINESKVWRLEHARSKRQHKVGRINADGRNKTAHKS